ncbi:PspC domain-containing protein [Amycolatopsis jiangsuensis]|uniref:Phage shock protein PspC (Stress-responsive transcriptional regulator) n=1 Tax=Amycolatopsis jiangsuensis TaxID=1181879 RepID=A0A840IWY3_9PSEU|nr:PspC domain-containing protein [Amycolatopsis jiangsuensis]MBB4686370.1 phage shock protein PspC (stress-responsive transcriptional regulator) [Amycolatopsis jiangsuensis]
MSGAEQRTSRGNPLNGFEETAKDFWLSRPRRAVDGRKVAGVAAGLGNRYGIDPVVIRVALVAATVFGGFGLVFYLLGWLLFPGENDEVSAAEALAGRGRTSMPKGFAIGLAIVLIPVTGWTFAGGWFDGGGLIGLVLLSLGLYFLHRSRGQDHRPAPVTAFAAGAAVPGTGAFTMSSDADTSAPAAAGFDPLAADPAGWDLPDPAAPVPPVAAAPEYETPLPRRRNSKIGGAAFGLAVLVAGTGVVLNLSDVPWFSLQHIIGMVLAVLGVGMVAGAFVRGGRGLIGLAVLLSIGGMLLTTSTFGDLDLRGGVGDLTATPRTVSELQPEYHHAAGQLDLDLTQLPASEPITTTVSNGAGDTTVTVPANADVTYSCETSAGDATCFGRSTDGVGQDPLTGIDNGADGPGGQKITLHVTNGVGTVEVRRG